METVRFTGAEGGARLAAAARARNTLAALSHDHATFVAHKLLQEDAYKIRGRLSEGRQRSVLVTRESRVQCVAYELNILTDLSVASVTRYHQVDDWRSEIELKEVVVATSAVIRRLLEEGVLRMDLINVLVVDSCHAIHTDEHLQAIMMLHSQKSTLNQPRILALTYPLFAQKSNVVISNDESELTSNDDTPLEADVSSEKDESIKEYEQCNVEEAKDISSEDILRIEDIIRDNKTTEFIVVKEEEVFSGKAKIIELDDDEANETITATSVKSSNTNDIMSEITLNSNEQCNPDFKEQIKHNNEIEFIKLDDNNLDLKDNSSVNMTAIVEAIADGVSKAETEEVDKTYAIEKKMDETASNVNEDATHEINESITCIYKAESEITKAKSQIEVKSSDSVSCVLPTDVKQVQVETEQEEGNGAAANKSEEQKEDEDLVLYEKLEWKIEELERKLCCTADLAEDIDGIKRLSATVAEPRELIVQYACRNNGDKLPETYMELDTYMRRVVDDILQFIHQHRYDPTEIYGEDTFCDELKDIPDPTFDPKEVFHQFLYVLDELGPYGADKAALSLIGKVEKLKVKTPYERHFLLLCLCTTVFLKIRCAAEHVFQKYESDWDKIQNFCTPKIHRLAEILEQFKPPKDAKVPKNSPTHKKERSEVKKAESIDESSQDVMSASESLDAARISDADVMSANKSLNSAKMLNEIDGCDFVSLGNRLADRVNTIEGNLTEIHDMQPNGMTAEKEEEKSAEAWTEAKRAAEGRGGAPGPRRLSSRNHGRGRTPRHNHAARALQMLQNPDALCGIVFMKEPLMARVLFMIVAELSRSHPSLGFLCTQYSGEERPADPVRETKELEKQRRKQEEVLKKFRMHECNLLLATSALEEGIDLPRCNLVLRWDPPVSYRSYSLCRSRARAARSSCVLLSDAEASACDALVEHVATYRELDQMLSRKCGCGVQDEPPQSEEEHANLYTKIIKPYTPLEPIVHRQSPHKNNYVEKYPTTSEKPFETNNSVIVENLTNKSDKCDKSYNCDKIGVQCDTISDHCDKMSVQCDKMSVQCDKISVQRDSKGDKEGNKALEEIASVDLSSAISLINRYCAKLPSDTFTRLAPQWWMEEVSMPASCNRRNLPTCRPTGCATLTQDGVDSTSHATIQKAYICTLRLPLNCPVKYNIVGHPMPTRVLARRMVALQACRILHRSGELDNQLMPIGKENFRAAEVEYAPAPPGDAAAERSSSAEPPELARPGTTKRRQYYYKRTAWSFTDCQPVQNASDADVDSPHASAAAPEAQPATEDSVSESGVKVNMLYAIVSRLWCALPERYNTRGRRLHVPQTARQGLGILTSRRIKKIPAFPVYTRSGEVRVSVEHVSDADVRVSPRRAKLVRRFMKFVFADVLRVRRRGMHLSADGRHNHYYVVPTSRSIGEDGAERIDIDWEFLELIFQHTERKGGEMERADLWTRSKEQAEEHSADAGDTVEKSEEPPAARSESGKKESARVAQLDNPLLAPDQQFVFHSDKYKEAVVTPWYRNQDQPQFFLVAEICWKLSPESAFPSAAHTTFRHYYTRKYGVKLTQADQPLLDVDHTSARLNLLTPRYVNRKGVALPVSSERTRRAKRDRLDQKQILVPELCRVHPFAAPLWFATVALPCVLYRINALLIADEIRRSVAIDVGLGAADINERTRPGFEWPPLDFGWSLAEVLSVDEAKAEQRREEATVARCEQDGETQEEEIEGEVKEKTLNDILQEKADAESGFEIGTWSNDMASSVPDDYDEMLEPLPPNLTFCTSASGGSNWPDSFERGVFPPRPSAPRAFSMADSDCSYMSSDLDTDDSSLNSDGSDDDTSGFGSHQHTSARLGVRIEYKTAHEAEAFELRTEKKATSAPQPDERDDARDRAAADAALNAGQPPLENILKFRRSVEEHKREILEKGLLIKENELIKAVLPPVKDIPASINNLKSVDVSKDKNIPIELPHVDIKNSSTEILDTEEALLKEIFPYDTIDKSLIENSQITIEAIEKSKRVLLERLKGSLTHEEIKGKNFFSMVDVNIDSPDYVNEKVANVGFDDLETYVRKLKAPNAVDVKSCNNHVEDASAGEKEEFDFDYQPKLEGHPGPSPSVILQALTMSNANDGINLERLETIGDSFLKFAITAYLYCAHPTVHEGKLSHMRSKQVSNLNLYRLGRSRRLGARMIASKFEPHDNWLPPCHRAPATMPGPNRHAVSSFWRESEQASPEGEACGAGERERDGCYIPYNLITQHSIPDKSVADCVEALIGAYLIECGPRGALLFMSWLGIKVLPRYEVPLEDCPELEAMEKKINERRSDSPRRPGSAASTSSCSSAPERDAAEEAPDSGEESDEPHDWSWPERRVGTLAPYRDAHGRWLQPMFGELKAPPSPLLRYIDNPDGELEQMLSGYDALEGTLRYRFRDRSLLLQALTHASHHLNRLTDCYQRLEFLGDAILDYLITRHLYEDERRHSPGALTDLRSALVNNTIFATLAVRHGFHKYFRHMSPGLNEVLTRYVKIQEENGHSISEEHYLIQEDEMEQAEDVEVPKALGDLFESVAGAIFLDSGMSLGAVWRSYVGLMGAELEAFSAAAPKSPVRELLEAEPDTAKFGKPERLADGRRVRVCVEVFGRGTFKGVGRNYRIAKGTAARCALRHLKRAYRT